MSFSEADIALCQTTARTLRWQTLPVLMSASALLGLMMTVEPDADLLSALSWLLLTLQGVWATRLYVDARVFELFANQSLSLEDFDATLDRLPVNRPPARPPRPLGDRVAGVHRLIRWQWLLTALCLLLPMLAYFGNQHV